MAKIRKHPGQIATIGTGGSGRTVYPYHGTGRAEKAFLGAFLHRIRPRLFLVLPWVIGNVGGAIGDPLGLYKEGRSQGREHPSPHTSTAEPCCLANSIATASTRSHPSPPLKRRRDLDLEGLNTDLHHHHHHQHLQYRSPSSTWL